MQKVHPDKAFRDHATAMNTKVSGAITALSLNRDVYNALSTLDVSRSDPATTYYVQRELLEFHLAGVDKDDATRARLRKLNDQLTDEQSKFDRNISDSRKSVTLTDRSELGGLPEDYLDRHKSSSDGTIVITTDDPDVYPALTFAKSDALRRRLYHALLTRAYPENLDVLKGMMQTRYEIARLLAYESWADYNAADKMIDKGEKIGAFIQQVDDATRSVTARESAMLLAEKRRTNPQAQEIGDYELRYLTELVRRSKYDFDSQSVRRYFPYPRVQQGVFDTAAKMFNISFKQESDAPGWDPTVETWDVVGDNKVIGRFYFDMHPREGKFSSAEMVTVLDGIRGKQLPEAALICNFPIPTATDPGLLQYEDVVTFFHEFGHLLHSILGGQQQWAGVSGISNLMEADFIEAPSQMLEEWMHSPQVLALFARDYKTGKPIDAALVSRMNRASAFGRAHWVARQNAYTAISYDIYRSKPQGVDLDAVCTGDMRRHGHLVPSQDNHDWASFDHLGPYSSAYYTYLWDKVIAEDFFQQFDQTNLLGGETPLRYRRTVLAPGGSMSANDLVRNFLGRPQNMNAFQHWMGEEFSSEAEKPKYPAH